MHSGDGLFVSKQTLRTSNDPQFAGRSFRQRGKHVTLPTVRQPLLSVPQHSMQDLLGLSAGPEAMATLRSPWRRVFCRWSSQLLNVSQH